MVLHCPLCSLAYTWNKKGQPARFRRHIVHGQNTPNNRWFLTGPVPYRNLGNEAFFSCGLRQTHST